MSSIDDFFDDDSFNVDEEPFYEESINPLKDSITNWIEENCDVRGTYKINNDNTIDVDGDIDVYTYEHSIDKLPDYIKFKYVSGIFDVNPKGDLNDTFISLKGCPKEVGKSFLCMDCKKLESLEGAPEKVGGDFDCSYCSSLESLEGVPKEVGGNFDCRGCF